MPLLEEGQNIRDTYVVERLIGEGAHAEVYRVKHRFLGRQALKILKQPGITDSDIHALIKEARLLTQIGHPNIIRVFDANTVIVKGHERGYFTMEHVATGTLEDYRTKFHTGPVGAEQAVALVLQIAEGLAVAHGQKPSIIHRDLKPQNILVSNEPEGLVVKISDFGLAQEVNPLTLMTTAAGTLAFKAPESVFEGGVDSKASDIWSLGVILYLLLTDRFPYSAPTEWGWSNKAFQKPHRKPSVFNIDANDALDSIVSKCLHIEPHQRYNRVTALLNDLKRWKPSRRLEGVVQLRNVRAKDFNSKQEETEIPVEINAQILLNDANELANAQRLDEAADKLEEAIRLHPNLRATQAKRVELWRKGLSS
jgi:serine/threonine-protein kinase